MNLLFPQVAHTPSGKDLVHPEEPELWTTALKDLIKEKLNNRSSASSIKSSTKTMTDNASIHSVVSTATTLKGTADGNKKKWYSLSSKSKALVSEPKCIKDSDREAARKAVHNEAVASYFSMR
ncbi:uncharacterized protein N7503_010984 [Penicillium pulvis]|uniref:uncharacterized protein n=1 Tax=Penicillium pulvis TaxID=1562058 RepID=UPI002549BDAE|nr:uncharacterized protein N7503_010984 [Penicillium pulvis]KAJ5785772.1 hypothetical protein N7503_010984 [Penicillium pulvis]